MNINTETLLFKEIDDELNELSKMEIGTDKYKATADVIAKLTDRAIELKKMDIEIAEKVENRKQDQLKIKQIEDEKIDRIVRNAISIAGIVVPVVVTVWGTIVTLKFEETGTVTTIMGRGFVNKLLPKK